MEGLDNWFLLYAVLEKDSNLEIYYPDGQSTALAAIWATLKIISRGPRGNITGKKSCMFFSFSPEAEGTLNGGSGTERWGCQPLSGTSVLLGAQLRP